MTPILGHLLAVPGIFHYGKSDVRHHFIHELLLVWYMFMYASITAYGSVDGLLCQGQWYRKDGPGAQATVRYCRVSGERPRPKTTALTTAPSEQGCRVAGWQLRDRRLSGLQGRDGVSRHLLVDTPTSVSPLGLLSIIASVLGAGRYI